MKFLSPSRCEDSDLLDHLDTLHCARLSVSKAKVTDSMTICQNSEQIVQNNATQINAPTTQLSGCTTTLQPDIHKTAVGCH
jgi:hypothetical protein